MQWQSVLKVVLTSEVLVTAAGSVTGLACMCEMMAALAAAGGTSAVVEAVRAQIDPSVCYETATHDPPRFPYGGFGACESDPNHALDSIALDSR
jgi:hypothetical protein